MSAFLQLSTGATLGYLCVAAGFLVHACYNLTLFTGLLIQTDGFKHLDKLKM